MLRIVVTVCALSQLATAYPQQRPGQVPAGGRPAASSPQGSYGPSYSQQLAFGPASNPISQAAAAAGAGPRARPGAYQSQQPIILQQGTQSASPATPTFSSFPGASPFGGAGRQILTLRSPQSADDDEYEYDDDDEPTLQGRPSPRPVIPVTRAPVRIPSPSPGPSIPHGAVPGRFNPSPVVQQQQPIRQRQPIPQQAVPQVSQPHAGRIVQAVPRPVSVNQQQPFGIDGKRSRLTTPPPIQTVNRYMKQNDDGSITWGYENEDGTFKEETLGADCVVRGKYGYIDPEGSKREYEYQTGNPCDPNKRDQEEEAEEEEDLPDGPSRGQQIAGLVNARPRPVQRRPVQGGGQIPQYQAHPQFQ